MPQIPYNEPVGLSYKHISTDATTVVKSSPGILSGIVVNSATTGAVVTIYDNTAGSGTTIATYTLGTITTPQPVVLYNVLFGTGLTIVTATALCDLTVIYK